MKINFISKIINYGLWQGADSLYIELNDSEFKVDYHSQNSDDLILNNSAYNKFINELKILTKHQKLDSGSSIYFKINTPINTRTVCLTSIAGKEHKYLIKVIEPNSTSWRLSKLAINSDKLKTIKAHLKKENNQGLIIVSSARREGKTSTIQAIAQEIKDLNLNILSLGKINDQIPYIDKDNKWLHKIDSQELISALNKNQAQIIINDIEDDNIIKALIEYSLNSDKLIISTLKADSSKDAWSQLLKYQKDKGLTKKINFILHQKLFKRLCPHCQAKAQHNSYEKRDLDNLSLKYNLKDVKENSYISSGCEKCQHSGYIKKVPAFEILSFQNPHLNSSSLLSDAYNKQQLGIISANDLLNITKI